MCWFLLSGVLKNFTEAVEAAAPDCFELLEQLFRVADDAGIAADQLLATSTSFAHEACSFQHRDVLLNGGETHRVVRGNR